MFSRLPMFQRQGGTAFKKDLTNSWALSNHLGKPETKFPTVHVAGTNGKGSTSHMIASVLQEAGYKTGLYTSPHLKDFRERIRIDGICIEEQEVIDFVDGNKSFLEAQGLSFFEMTVGLAFHHFASKEVDIAVIEVGLGGRLDSTNIISPLVSGIINIGLDHTQFLGENLVEIAGEKGGIIKEKTPVVIGEFQEEVYKVFEDLALKQEAPIYQAEKNGQEFETDLLGSYQKRNVKTAVCCLDLLKDRGYRINEQSIASGLMKVVSNTGLKGRWQILQQDPKVICDTAHNREGLKDVMSQLKGEEYRQLHIVLGVVEDKNLATVLPLFPEQATYYFCKPDIPRGLDAESLQEVASEFELKGEVYASVMDAYEEALDQAASNDLIYAGGSTFVVAELPI